MFDLRQLDGWQLHGCRCQKGIVQRDQIAGSLDIWIGTMVPLDDGAKNGVNHSCMVCQVLGQPKVVTELKNRVIIRSALTALMHLRQRSVLIAFRFQASEFKPRTAEEAPLPPCRVAMHVKSVDDRTSSRWCGMEFHAKIVEVEIGGVANYCPFGNFSELNRTVTCMVAKANDRRTSSPLPR
ncbi:hypothetical protein TNCV_898251 [Trichonephila clavipes]|nr:hypothetical protein TNCV_898251 [Trichonephila clavipes]